MTKLTDEQFEKFFGTYKDKIVVETEQKQKDLVETTQGSSNDLATITINLVPQNELIDICNIPMLEYSALFREDADPAINTHAKAILTNYNNRSIEQINAVDDIISNGYSTVESAVLWLEIINSNLNQLMGLVGVNNYLFDIVSVGGAGGQSEQSAETDYLNVLSVVASGATLAGPEGAAGALLFYEMLKTDSDDLKFMLAGAYIGWSMGGPAGALIATGLSWMITHPPETLPNVENQPNYLTGGWGYSTNEPNGAYMIGLPLSQYEPKFPSWLPSSEYEKYAENYGDKPVTEKSETNNLQSIATQELTGLAKAVLSIEQSDMFKTHTTSGTDTVPKRNSGASMSSEQSLTVSENKTSTNASISEDLTNSTFSGNKYGPQQIEHTYEMPITNHVIVNVENDTDYEKITKHVVNSMSDRLYNAATVRGMIQPSYR